MVGRSVFLGMGTSSLHMAALAGVIDFLGEPRVRRLRAAWIHAVGNVLAVILSIFNLFIHSRDAWTSVVPQGIWLSGIAALLLLVVGVRGWSATQRRAIGEGEGE